VAGFADNTLLKECYLHEHTLFIISVHIFEENMGVKHGNTKSPYKNNIYYHGDLLLKISWTDHVVT
jgi:hypothetical protein